MKKCFIFIVLFAICINMMRVPALASTINLDTKLIERELYNLPSYPSAQSGGTVFLSNGSVSVSLFAPAAIETQSSDCYITNTQKILIKLKSSHSITVKVSLYRIDGTDAIYVSGATKDLGTLFNTSWTFTNLNQGDTYYFTVSNLGQRDVSVTGTVSE